MGGRHVDVGAYLSLTPSVSLAPVSCAIYPPCEVVGLSQTGPMPGLCCGAKLDGRVRSNVNLTFLL